MSNTVEIIYQATEKYPQIYVNGEEIGQYSELQGCMYSDIFEWADDLFRIMDDQIYEEYVLIVTGHTYHSIVLRAAQKKSRFCTNVQHRQMKSRISMAEKYRYACEISALFAQSEDAVNRRLLMHTSTPELYRAMGLADVDFTEKEALYAIGAPGEEAMLSAKGKICILLSEEEEIRCEKGKVYLYTSRSTLPVLVDYLNTYHIRLGIINKVFLETPVHTLTTEQRLEFEAYRDESYRAHIQELPTEMECGQSAPVSYTYYPKCFPQLNLYAVSEPADGVVFQNNTLYAQREGSYLVRFTDAAGVVYGESRVAVCKHNYVNSIMVLLNKTTMVIGETMDFRCVTTPVNAEDRNQLSYSVSDEKVLIMSGENQIYAVSGGRACVTVSTPRVSYRFYITVLPQANSIMVSDDEIKIVHAGRATVCAAVMPRNAFPMPQLIWRVSDPKVMCILRADQQQCTIQTNGIGTATLICSTASGDIHKEIQVKVTKPKGCYIATAVYGSYDCPEVWALRRFRDQWLGRSWLGRRFIDAYYAVSPAMVKLFGKRKWFTGLWKKCLDKMVSALQKRGYETTPYDED